MIRTVPTARAALALASLVSLAAGCGGSSSPSGSTSPAANPPSALAFVVSPTATPTDAAIDPTQGIQVALRDASGMPTTGSYPVTLSIVPGTGNVGGNITGTATVQTTSASGVATFRDIAIDMAGTGYELRASSSGLTSVTSSAFDVGVRQSAIDGVGQLDAGGSMDFTAANQGLSATATSDIWDVALDRTNHRLFAADYTNARVLIYSLSTANDFTGKDRAADGVVGQASFDVSDKSSPSAVTMSGAYRVALDGATNRLFASDWDNHRVLVYDVGTGTPVGPAASLVLGQTTMTATAGNTTESTFVHPAGLAYDGTSHRLYVSDSGNNRVLVFDAAQGTLATGASATAVTGQPDFTSSGAAVPATATSLMGPEGLAIDAARHRLFVADYGNNRVLVYDTAAILTTGTAAIAVLGQPDLASSGHAVAADALYNPHGLCYDATSDLLFVSDLSNERVLAYRGAAIATGARAAWVLGEPDFTTALNGTTAELFNPPSGLAYDPTTRRLWVADSGNYRALVFQVE